MLASGEEMKVSDVSERVYPIISSRWFDLLNGRYGFAWQLVTAFVVRQKVYGYVIVAIVAQVRDVDKGAFN